jgi:hypothetical protein
MKALIIGVICLLLSTSTNACEPSEISFNKYQVCASLKWVYGPTFNEFNTLEVTLRSEGATDLETSYLKVIPWMVMSGGHEHGSRLTEITQNGNELYIVKKIFFPAGMQGDWFLRLQFLDDQMQLREEVRTPVIF